jgi:hypothetical protein
MFSTTACITHATYSETASGRDQNENRSRRNPIEDLNKVRGRQLALGSEPWFLVVLILSTPSANFHARGLACR